MDIVLRQIPAILFGLQTTLMIAVVSLVFAIAIGIVVAGMRLSPLAPLRWTASAYVLVFRSLPLYVFLLWLYYGLAMMIGVNFSPIVAGIVVLSMQYGAQLSEVFRAGIGSIGVGQHEAAYSLGLTRYRTYERVIIPQAVRVIIPPSMNTFVAMIKDTAIVSVIGISDLMRIMEIQSNYYFRPFEFYTTAALIYIGLVLVMTRVSDTLEKRFSRAVVSR